MAKKSFSGNKKDKLNSRDSTSKPISGSTDQEVKPKLYISGLSRQVSDSDAIGEYKMVASYSSVKARGEMGNSYEVDPSMIGQAILEDDTVWFGYVGDLDELFTVRQTNRSDEEEGSFLTDEIPVSANRGILKFLRRKLLNLFNPSVTEATAAFIAEKVDKKVMPSPGLYTVDDEMNLTPYRQDHPLSGKILLLLHGTLSSTKGSFDDLNVGALWKSIRAQYDYVLTLEHRTVSVTPITNALDILKSFSPNLTIDILSQSRGGLIGDILCRCDCRNRIKGFSLPEQQALAEENAGFNDLISELNRQAELKRLTVRRFVRVASPSNGTTILGDRIDVFLNALLNVVGLAFGSKGNVIYSAITEFLMDVLSHRKDAKDMPGLWSMVTSSTFQKINNNPDNIVNSELYVIAGDATVGDNLANSIAVILTNIYFWRKNDFVVDTVSMKKGTRRASGLYYYLSDIPKTNHFNYFKNENSRSAIFYGLQGISNNPDYSFTKIEKADIDRGVGIKIEANVFNCDNITGQKPIAILLPGIMGSTLADAQSDLWLSILRLNKGALVNDMNIGAPGIYITGVMEKYYKKLGNFMLRDHELKVFGFDWRKDMAGAAKELDALLVKYMEYGRPIHIIAHSMGGLVMKQLMIHHNPTWTSFCKGANNFLFLLGTPWLGSHLIMEVLTGHSDRVRMLNLIDFHHKRKEIIQTVAKFPGVLQLLPMTEEGFGTAEFWTDMQQYADDTVVPDNSMLELYGNYKQSTSVFALKPEEAARVIYIAGHSKTVNGYKIKKRFFTGKKLVYTTTTLGDGSVTWELGIPDELPKSNIYYSEISHGQLANEQVIFEAIDDIIRFGSSGSLPQIPPVSRGLTMDEFKSGSDFIPENDEQIIDIIFNESIPESDEPADNMQINVSVYNADLKYSAHPVLVGHFLNDGLFSAEKSLDNYLKQKLSERHRLGFYPGEIGASEVTYQSDSKPKGALVVGLGTVDQLTAYRLSITVEKAIIQYAFFFRDNYSKIENKSIATGISSILLGTSFAGLPVSECVRAILAGVRRANQRMVQLNSGLKPIREIEFVDYYEDIAQQCYKILKDIEANQDSMDIVVGQFEKGPGLRRRLSLYDGAAWWHTFNTSAIYIDGYPTPRGLSFSSTSGRARIEQNGITTDLKMVEYLAKEFSHRNTWDVRLSKTMFELLVPNDFKSIIRNQNNIVWKMDEYSAQFPWEMFHDYSTLENAQNETPTFVNTGMIRQLLTDKYRNNPIVADNNKAFIVGDPDYSGTDFPQLIGAEQEANEVSKVLKMNGFNVSTLIKSNAQRIITDLYSDRYKIMHFAAHGLYEEAVGEGISAKAGIVLGKDLVLEPGMINQLSYVPEFIFINCCYSGDMTGLDEKYYKGRSNLAANIGTQLIRMGVKAVVVAGWSVDDAAAHTFSAELYRKLFDGYEFGDAVLSARRKCYDYHRTNNTWGAYQCYGDHYYKLINKSVNWVDMTPYVTESQAIIDLQNELSFISGQKVNKHEYMIRLENIIKKVRANSLETGFIKELYAKIYIELGEYEAAVNELEELFKIEKAEFSVSSLEQYSSLKGKILIKNYRKTGKVDNKALDNLISDIKLLDYIGITAERRALKASLYKRISFLRRNDPETRIRCLKKMKEYYAQSYEIVDKAVLADSIYALSGYFFALYLLNTRNIIGEMNKLCDTHYENIQAMISDIIRNLQVDKEGFRDFYRSNSIAKVYFMEFMLTDNPAATESSFKNLKTEMLSSIENFGNLKTILREIENLELVSDMLTMKKDQKKVKLLMLMKNEIESML